MRCLRLTGLFAALLVFAFTANPAFARPYHHYHHRYYQHQQQAAFGASCVLTNDGRQICGGLAAQAYAPAMGGGFARYARVADEGAVIGGRPAGCPNRYCGCGLRKYLGLEASNWARVFPRVAGPAVGVAAVRGGHVMYIEGAAGNGQWLVRDYNSGGGLSRVHVRDVRGYVFVNPHGGVAGG